VRPRDVARLVLHPDLALFTEARVAREERRPANGVGGTPPLDRLDLLVQVPHDRGELGLGQAVRAPEVIRVEALTVLRNGEWASIA